MTSAQGSADQFLVIDRVSKRYNQRGGDKRGGQTQALTVVDDVSLTVGAREFVAIIGPSGCGKSTLMNCIGGLVDYDDGSITIGGTRVDGPGEQTAVVFQAASLLPWLSVKENVAFGMKLRRSASASEIEDRVQRAVSMVGLSGFEKHLPHEISGGMQQRVNLARALVVEAPLILMDEPFGALDALTKEAMQDELSALHGEIDRAVVFITHDIREAVYLADKVVVMSPRPGKIVAEIDVSFARPRDRSITDSAEFEEIARQLREMLHPRA